MEEKATAKEKKASVVKTAKATARRLQLDDDGRQQSAAQELDHKRSRIKLKEKVSAKKKKASMVKMSKATAQTKVTRKTKRDNKISTSRPKSPATGPPPPRQPIWLQEKKRLDVPSCSRNIYCNLLAYFVLVEAESRKVMKFEPASAPTENKVFAIFC